jgi:transglutaminase-like putative cysteine protease
MALAPAAPALTRAQLGALALTVVACTLPHVASAAPWVLAGLALAVGWRAGGVLYGWPLPGRFLRGALTLSATFAVGWHYHSIAGLDAGSALLLLMLALKLLETTGSRDRSVVVLIAWFVLFAGFLREQTLASVALLVAGIGAGLLALLQGARNGPALPLPAALKAVGRLTLHAAPLAIALFVLFPRLPGPFWAMPAPGSSARTGLSDEMSPGDISSLARSDAVAFRVRFSDATPVATDLYWRGPVLDRYDGRRWRAALDSGGTRTLPPRPEGRFRSYDYEVMLEPHDGAWLLPLDTPLDWDLATAELSGAMELRHSRSVDRRLAYRARSVAGGAFRPGQPPSPTTRAVARQRNPRTQALAGELRRQYPGDREFLLAILARFRTEEFFYTLEPPLLGADPVDDFLFRTRSGFCEHYAAAFTLLARAGGLPARVVTGYQGGEWNPIGGHWVIRQSDAHAWTEVFVAGRWVRFDPTAAVAPQRIELGLEAALPELAGGDLPLPGGQRLLDAIALRWDALNANWDRLVLAFGPDQQLGLLAALGVRRPGLRDIALACAIAIAVVLVAFTVVELGHPRRARDPLGDAWRELTTRLARVTRPRAPAEAPGEYAAAVLALRPDLAPAVRSLVDRYVALRYERTPAAADIAAFRRAVRRFRPR